MGAPLLAGVARSGDFRLGLNESSGLQPVLRRHSPEPFPRVLDCPLLRRIIHVAQPEALAVTLGPLEIVQQAPRVISAHISPFGDRLRHSRDVALMVSSATVIANGPARVRP